MAWYFIFILGILVGIVAGMIISRYTMKSYLKKNPPIGPDQLKQLAASMGRNLSQKQINQMINQMKK
ncbi:MAG: YneF family protein [Lactobacillaceae bacterium]|jgi:uncharacterized protein YneF (UPF0154 family)|nr:YneF family protein [Lactobacillaceae bacterium]